jgi:hypothetical protein
MKGLEKWFFCGTISMNDKQVLQTIKGKWLETIVHITKFAFLNLSHFKQVQFFISIWICGKF